MPIRGVGITGSGGGGGGGITFDPGTPNNVLVQKTSASTLGDGSSLLLWELLMPQNYMVPIAGETQRVAIGKQTFLSDNIFQAYSPDVASGASEGVLLRTGNTTDVGLGSGNINIITGTAGPADAMGGGGSAGAINIQLGAGGAGSGTQPGGSGGSYFVTLGAAGSDGGGGAGSSGTYDIRNSSFATLFQVTDGMTYHNQRVTQDFGSISANNFSSFYSEVGDGTPLTNSGFKHFDSVAYLGDGNFSVFFGGVGPAGYSSKMVSDSGMTTPGSFATGFSYEVEGNALDSAESVYIGLRLTEDGVGSASRAGMLNLGGSWKHIWSINGDVTIEASRQGSDGNGYDVYLVPSSSVANVPGDYRGGDLIIEMSEGDGTYRDGGIWSGDNSRSLRIIQGEVAGVPTPVMTWVATTAGDSDRYTATLTLDYDVVPGNEYATFTTTGAQGFKANQVWTFTDRIMAIAGTNTAPGISFGADGMTGGYGIYRDGIADSINVVIDGADMFIVDASHVTVGAPTLLLPDGNNAAPGMAFANSTGTGINYNSGAGYVEFNIIGTEIFSYTTTGVIVEKDLWVEERTHSKQGADVTAANDITLGEGNYFLIQGSTDIQRIANANWRAGDTIILKSDDGVTVKNAVASGGGFASILCEGSADMVMAAGASIDLFYNGAEFEASWRRQP